MKSVFILSMVGLAVTVPPCYQDPRYFWGPMALWCYQHYHPNNQKVILDFTPQIHAQGGSGPDGRIHGGYQVGGQVPIGGNSVGGSVSGTFGHGSDLPRGYQVGGSIPVGSGHVGINVGGNFGHSPNSVGISESWPIG